MNILIKGMEKPKTCEECRFYVDKWCYALEVESDGEKKWLKGTMTCPLIEIVECKDCKYSRVYSLISDLPMSRWCEKGYRIKRVEDTGFCSYGERREDNDQRNEES